MRSLSTNLIAASLATSAFALAGCNETAPEADITSPEKEPSMTPEEMEAAAAKQQEYDALKQSVVDFADKIKAKMPAIDKDETSQLMHGKLSARCTRFISAWGEDRVRQNYINCLDQAERNAKYYRIKYDAKFVSETREKLENWDKPEAPAAETQTSAAPALTLAPAA